MRKILKLLAATAVAIAMVVLMGVPAFAASTSAPPDTGALAGLVSGFLTLVVPLALLDERAVALVRSLVPALRATENHTVDVLLVFAAFLVGVGICVGWGFNYVGALAHSIPALSTSSALDGTAGQVLTGLAVGAAAGFWHDRIAVDKARRKSLTA